LSEFKQRDKYIKDDHRFKDRVGKYFFVDFVNHNESIDTR